MAPAIQDRCGCLEETQLERSWTKHPETLCMLIGEGSHKTLLGETVQPPLFSQKLIYGVARVVCQNEVKQRSANVDLCYNHG